MSRCEHNHLAHYKPFCLCCKFKFYYPEILREVGGADTPKIKFCFPDIFRLVGGVDTQTNNLLKLS